MASHVLKNKLVDWVKQKESNGIIQHSVEWERVKIRTIGGSSMSTIQGRNPYTNVYKLIAEKIGLSRFNSDIKPQWGNLFEDVIKRYVEYDRKCEILGEDLFVAGPPGTSYSPDGLAVMDIVEEYMFEEETYVDTSSGKQKRIELVVKSIPKTSIVLVEFKCPYSRIPSGNPPEYYIPQVKTGLDILEIPSIGLFIEGVFRRCSWDSLGNNPLYDKTLVPRSSGKLPLAYGILGFYIDVNAFEQHLEKLRADPHKDTPDELIAKKNNVIAQYNEHFVEYGNESNDFMCNDLGDCPPELFKSVMDAYDKNIVKIWYGQIAFVDTNMINNNGKASADDIAGKLIQMDITRPQYTEEAGIRIVNNDLDTFTQFCRTSNYINIGILPWKLFRIDYNYIQKEERYVQRYLPKITEILDIVCKCLDAPDVNAKQQIYNNYVTKCTDGGFSDE